MIYYYSATWFYCGVPNPLLKYEYNMNIIYQHVYLCLNAN